MPVSYKGIISEHESVRTKAGIFDVGHMGIIDIIGRDSLSFILHIATNNASILSENEGQYSVICSELGGTVDDVFVFKLSDFFRFVVNASNTEKVFDWFKINSKNYHDLKIEHRIDLGILSVQGPKAKEFLKASAMPPRNYMRIWGDLLFSHTGYTGEDGFEFFVPIDSMVNVWDTFISLGINPCGLGARDTLRLEAGLPLYGHEYDDETSPLEAGYSWAVKFDHEFIGRSALLKQQEAGVPKKLVGLKFSDKAIPRQGIAVMINEKQIGVITSGTFSPTLKIPVALAYISPDRAQEGSSVDVKIRGNFYKAVVSKKKMI